MLDNASAHPPPTGLTRVLGNFAWLLGGKGFGAVCSLLYLAILSRSLGIRDFGHFSLIFGTGQALVAFAGSQTWQVVVRYGARHVHAEDWPRFGRLAMFCGTIDAIGATAGCGIAYVVYYGFGAALELNPAYVDMAFAFNCALLWARVTSSAGIVRVLNRFDIGTYVEAVVPAGRLIAGTAIWLTGPSVERFLFAWAAIDLLAAALYWAAAYRLRPEALRLRYFGRWRQALRENPGAGRFIGITYAGSALDAVYRQGPLLAVGYFLGTSAAGVYRLADQLAQGFGKLSALLARAIYSEFVHARVASTLLEFRKLVRQVTIIAATAGTIVVLLALFAGKDVLMLIGGPEFGRGGAILLPLAIGASFELASVTYEPTLHSTGHASYPLIARLIAVIALAAGIMAFAGDGAVGVGWANALGLAILYLTMSLMVWLVLRGLGREEAARKVS